jgi:hypothetical protein
MPRLLTRGDRAEPLQGKTPGRTGAARPDFVTLRPGLQLRLAAGAHRHVDGTSER